MDRRIATTQAQVKTLEDLVSPVPGEDYPLFDTKQKALMFAAALGFHMARKAPLAARDQSTAIRFDIFEKALDDGFVAALAVSACGELGVLAEAREDEFAQIFEECANAGLMELKSKVLGQVDPLHALIAVMADARFPEDESGLEGLDHGVLAGLLGR
jgi:dnd system-associated protein 4